MSLLRMELLKLVKRPMTRVLFVLLHGGIGFGIVLGFLNLRGVESDVRDAILADLTMPGIFPWAAGLLAIFGSIMLSILAASAIGSEYSWGTLRPMLATGMPRANFLAAKLAALAIVAFTFLMLAMLMCAALAVPIALLYDRPMLNDTFDLAWVGGLAAVVGRTYLAIAVPMVIAFLVALAGRSQAAGIGAGLGMLIGEQVVGLLLSSTGLDWAEWIVQRLPSYNTQSLLRYNRTFSGLELVPGTLGQGTILLTLAIYAAICVAAAFAFFSRRDIRGAA